MQPRRQIAGGDICAIFIHAGAGYHSVQNEVLHLGAVRDAAKVGMAILKNGGDALDAVEMALRLLEDREITNAGYGSNLTIEGQVECDATMVDHLGRSGAVGAVSQVKNPIALARLVLDASVKPLSLQRVPPILLVGLGASDFAFDQGMPILPPDYLISSVSYKRWLGWKQDLQEHDEQEVAKHGTNATAGPRTGRAALTIPSNTMSPPTTPIHSLEPSTKSSNTSVITASAHSSPVAIPTMAAGHGSHEPDLSTISRYALDPRTFQRYARVSDAPADTGSPAERGMQPVESSQSPTKRPRLDGSDDGSDSMSSANRPVDVEDTDSVTTKQYPAEQCDHITDTVGAIAVDCFGNIAAGSSSGGIGMKHKGRCGPAALVGIGTAVVPVDGDDPEHTSVATVTSGTGEHMATTSAATTAAHRIYQSVRRRGAKLEPCTEDEALYSMIQNDFMGHAGVRNAACTGAIGILAVKKTQDGVYFYFGHNTESFALASMHSEERQPVVTMSRNKGFGAIAQGGRVARTKRARR